MAFALLATGLRAFNLPAARFVAIGLIIVCFALF